MAQKKQVAKKKPTSNTWFIVGVIVCAFFAVVLSRAWYSTYIDPQCTTTHQTTSQPITNPVSAMDYFTAGNYEYDRGNCTQAITNYTKSLQKDSNYPQAYNNRAYTYMRMQQYAQALPDLNKAIQLNPSYVNALMNRGDLHNYYYQIDRKTAIADYDKVISLGATKNTNVCGHKILAQSNGWHVVTLFKLLMQFNRSKC